MSAKMDMLRADLRPGAGVMVKIRSEPKEEWEWGTITAIATGGFLVEIWDKHQKYTRMCETSTVFPDDATWEEMEEDVAPFSTIPDSHTASANANNVISIATGNVTGTQLKSTTKSTYADELPPDETFVFVYGTLKKGGRLHKYLANAEFIGKDQTAFKKYNMFSVSDMYPAVTENKGTCAIEGEIYKITPEMVKLLDDVEGAPFLYTRGTCWCASFEKKCYIYLATMRIRDAYELQRGPKIKFDKEAGSLAWKN